MDRRMYLPSRAGESRIRRLLPRWDAEKARAALSWSPITCTSFPARADPSFTVQTPLRKWQRGSMRWARCRSRQRDSRQDLGKWKDTIAADASELGHDRFSAYRVLR